MSSNTDPFELWASFKKKEAQVIAQFKKAFPLDWENNIGNDCAIINPAPGKKILVTKDILVEGVHFYPNMPLDALAYKAIMVNISDICADGGMPKGLLLGITIPPQRMDDMLEFSKYLIKTAQQFHTPIIGGDTVVGKEFNFSITCFGETTNPWLRKNAKIGDYIYMTGSIGASGHGFNLLQTNNQYFDLDNPYIKSHCYPPYLYPLVEYFNENQEDIHAAVDISDGFFEDLSQILLESEKSCELWEDKISIAPGVDKDKAYYSGEDYQLILTSPTLFNVEKINTSTGISITPIGKIMQPIGQIGEIFNEQGEKVFVEKGLKQKFFHF